jgi:tripartite-type tricarboxylate transporter receptor subunit TctC
MKVHAHKLAAALLLICGTVFSAYGQARTDFYKGKQIRLIIGHPVGGDSDVGARFLAKYLQKHLPGYPTIVVQNMPQAATIVAANYVYGQAPRDGTVLGSFSRNFVTQALIGQPNITAEPRHFIWLGSFSFPSRVCVNWHTAAVKTPEDMFTQELIVAGGGTGSSLSIIPTVLNHVLGAKFRIIPGYKGINDAALAIQRGEVQGVCMSYGQFTNYEPLIREGKLKILLHAEESPVAEIPDVPSIYSYAKTDEQRQLMRFIFSGVEFGRPYVFPPGVPEERVEIMRQALSQVAKDPDMLLEAEKLKLDMTYHPPSHLERLVESLYQTPPGMIEAVKKLVPNLE